MRWLTRLLCLIAISPGAFAAAPSPAGVRLDPAAIRSSIERGSPVDSAGPDGSTWLMGAAQQQQAELVSYLLRAGASPNRQSSDGRTALMFAVAVNEPKIVKALLDSGANPNLQTDKGISALHLAVFADNADTVELLISARANVNHRDRSGRSALSSAVFREQLEIVRLLITSGATANDSGLSDLQVAAMLGNQDIAELLLNGRADPTVLTSDGESLVDLSLSSTRIEAALLVFARDLNPELRSPARAPVTSAARTRLAGMFKAELSGRQLLKAVMEKDQVGVVAALRAGADPGYRRRSSSGPLIPLIQIATESSTPAILELLLRAPAIGADAPYSRDDLAFARYRAIEARNMEALGILLAFGRPAMSAPELVSALRTMVRGIEEAADPRWYLPFARRVFDAAPVEAAATVLDDDIILRYPELVALLIDAGAQVNPGGQNAPLRRAISTRNVDAMRLLLAAGAPLKADAIVWRDVVSSLPMTKVLIGAGFRPSWKDNPAAGTELVDLAASYVNPDLLEALLAEPEAAASIHGVPAMVLLSRITGRSVGNAEWEEQLGRVAGLLIDTGINLNTWGKQPDEKIQHAVMFGHIGMVRAMLSRGAIAKGKITTAFPGVTETLITMAVNFGSLTNALGRYDPALVELIPLLVAAGVDPNTPGRPNFECRTFGSDCISWPPLLMAVSYTSGGPTVYPDEARRIELVQALIANGAKVNARSSRGTTALQLAKAKGNARLIQVLEQAGAR